MKEAGRATDRVASGVGLVVRRKRWLPPLLHPRAGRRMPPELTPEKVYWQATELREGVRGEGFRNLLQTIDQGPLHRDGQITPYFDGASAFAEMLAALAGAQHEILLEAYIISADATGQAFLAELTAAVERGVVVHVLADSFGSSRTRRDFWNLLRRGGSRFRLFHRPRYAPVSWLPILDHRKLLVIDRQLAFTGGMNVADEYRTGVAGEPAWRDTHVKMAGGIAWECAVLFGESWLASGGDPMRFGPHLTGTQKTAMDCLLLDSRPGRGVQEVYAAFAAIIGAARERLWITNAYFAPNRQILNCLKRAAQRGVDVRLLLPRQSDIPIIKAASRGYYSELMAAGVKVFEYLPAVLHAKTVVADAYLGVIGSTNFDFRSFAFNHECNVLSYDADLARALEEHFLLDIGQASRIEPGRWSGRPWWRKWLHRGARALAPVL